MSRLTTNRANQRLTKFLNEVSESATLRMILPVLKTRALANGLYAEEFAQATNKVKTLDDLRYRLTLMAANYQEKARYWDDLGLLARARDHHLQAALWSFYAQLIMKDTKQKSQTYNMCSRNYELAAPYFSYPARKIEIPYKVASLKGYLRLPGNEEEIPYGSLPVVVLLNAHKSTKEELHYTEHAFLRQGIATLSFDYPGTGESLSESFDLLNLDSLCNAIVLFIAETKVLDANRIALHGASIGGTIALSLAAKFPQLFKVCVSLSAPSDVLVNKQAQNKLKRELLSQLVQDDEDISQLAQKFSLHSTLSGITCSTLIIGGGKDVFVPFAETKNLFELVSCQDKKLVICSRAKHICFEMMPSLRYEIAQWVQERI
ncbi:MAG: esterase FrsA [Candidatus Obscuribacterales bacterium]|nr:esterase FrsA [Candidatus Obscuribacterales bacterium]